MEILSSRYRNLTVLVVVIVGQVLLLAYQVKTAQDIPLIRVWAVNIIIPTERALEALRRNTFGFVEDYLVLLNTRQKNQDLKTEVDRLKMENQFLKTELQTADRARALSLFQRSTPSRTIVARILGTEPGTRAQSRWIDRGTDDGVERSMAVLTPDGIVGKVVKVYVHAAQVLLLYDQDFAAGVLSEKNHVRGVLKGYTGGKALVDSIQNEEKVDVGERFFTAGDDRIFPKGFPVGVVSVVRPGRVFKEVFINPSGFQNGLEEVLVVLNGVHQIIPEVASAPTPLHTQAPPPADSKADPDAKPANLDTEADRIKEHYRKLGAAQGHAYGEPGSNLPNFNLKVDPAKPLDKKASDAKPKPPQSLQDQGGATTVPPVRRTPPAIIPGTAPQ